MKFEMLFISLFLAFTFACQHKPEPKQTAFPPSRLEKEFRAALMVQDTSRVDVLIKANRYRLADVFEELSRDYFRARFQPERQDAKPLWKQLNWLAELHYSAFKDSYYKNRLRLFGSWDKIRQKEKRRADSLSTMAKQLLDEKDYEPCKKLNSKALELYKHLQDKENQARTLNSLGLCLMNLREFKKAQTDLNQALVINRQLGLKQNEMVNLNSLGDVFQKQRKFTEALGYFHQSLDMARAIGDEVSAGYKLSNIGNTYYLMDDQKQAEVYLLKALKIAEKHRIKNLKSIVCQNLGSVYADLSQFDKAIDWWHKGLKIAKEMGNEEKEGAFLSNLSVVYRNIGKYDEALQVSRRALKLNIATKARWTEANTLREIGVNLYLKGLPDSAFYYWQQSLAKYTELTDTAAMGMLTGYIGIYYKNSGLPDKALDYYRRALKLTQATGDEREASNIMSNMGNIYNDLLGDYDSAEQLFKRAIAIKKKIGETHYGGVILGNLGLCYKNRGDYQQALEAFYESLKIARKTKNTSGEAIMLSHIGDVYQDVSSYQDAREYYQKAQAIFARIGEVKPQIEIWINQGSIFLDLNQIDSALACYQRALALARKIKQGEFECRIYYQMGNAWRIKGDLRKALYYFDQTEKRIKQTRDVRLHAGLYRERGHIYYQSGDLPAALLAYQQSKHIGEEIRSPEVVWQAEFGIGQVMEKLDSLDGAEQAYKQAIKTIEAMRTKLKASPLKETFLQDKIEVYHALIKLLLKRGQDSEAYRYLERSRARTFLDILSTSRMDFISGMDSSLAQRKRNLERRREKILQQLRQTYWKEEKTKPRQKALAALGDSLAALRTQHKHILEEIYIRYPHYSELTGHAEPLSLTQVQKRILKPGMALVEYLVGDRETIVWVIKTHSCNPIIIPVSRDSLTHAVGRLLQPFREARAGKIMNLADIRFDTERAHQLYQAVFAPLEKYLSPGEELIIIPDDVLFYLPFEALVTNTATNTIKAAPNILFSQYRNVRFLVEQYAISYAPSASVLASTMRWRKPKPSKEAMLAFGNPDFKRGIDLAFQSSSDQTVKRLSAFRASQHLLFAPLPKSETEIATIAHIIHPTIYYLNREAKEETFKRKAGNYPLIHLATHAIVDEMQPLYSRIVFAQDDDPAEDGFLHTYEVFNLHLNADLVTLSACETGLGRYSRGEGIIGLSRAFIYAGSASLLVSLWSVSESTVDLMQHFYDNLHSGMNKARSLQQAKLRLIRSESRLANGQKFSLAHPFLWAPFVLVGDWEGIK